MKKKQKCLLIILLACYLGLHNGYLAIIDSEANAPLEIFPYSAALFPQSDQEALARGIPINDKYEYHRALEDFLS